jgi:hypothetical protein
MEDKEMSYLVISKISKAKSDFPDIGEFIEFVNAIKTEDADRVLDNAMITGDLISRTYGFSEDSGNFVTTISSNWLSQQIYESYHNQKVSIRQREIFESQGFNFETILP